jgi:hypothetical protein
MKFAHLDFSAAFGDPAKGIVGQYPRLRGPRTIAAGPLFAHLDHLIMAREQDDLERGRWRRELERDDDETGMLAV